MNNTARNIEIELKHESGNASVLFARYEVREGRYYTGPWHDNAEDASRCTEPVTRRVNARMVRQVKYTEYLDLGYEEGVVCLVDDDLAQRVRTARDE